MNIEETSRRCLRRLMESFSVSAWAVVCLSAFPFSVGANPQSVGAEDDVGLRYVWEPGFVYECKFKITADVVDTENQIVGTVTYTPKGTALEGIDLSLPRMGSGTAFVVNPDGALITCAHVVDGAFRVDAHLGGKTYPARIVARDDKNDLALLQIQAKDLPHLPFRDSDEVELGQEVRAAGFPLSDVLDESLKLSSGTVSGIVTQGNFTRLQIDARVNPGNSGGPLLDLHGRVVGIASELLLGQSIDSIGFAVPANKALALLRDHETRWTEAPNTPALEGPQLAKKIAPAVVLLKTVGKGKVSLSRRTNLAFTASFSLFADVDGRSKLIGSEFERDDMVADSAGAIYEYDSKKRIPLVHLPIGQLGLERLPEDDRDEWETSRMVTIVKRFRVESSDSNSSSTRRTGPAGSSVLPYRRPGYPHPSSRYPSSRHPSSRYPSSLYPRSSQPENKPEIITTLVPAVEEVEYRRISKTAEGLVTIAKRTHLHREESGSDDPWTIDVRTSGTCFWDSRAGHLKEARIEGQQITTYKNQATRIPFTLTYEMTKKKPAPPKPKPVPPEPKPTKPAPTTTPSTDIRDDAPNSKPVVQEAKPEDGEPAPVRMTPSSPGLSKFRPDE